MTELCKLFVGNVPFNCNSYDFQKCFEHMIGFIKAEVIYNHNSNLSRGFGFVLFDSYENASKLLFSNNIMINNRTLRFTEYNNSIILDKIDYMDNFIMIKNINNLTRNELYDIFKEYGVIGKYFIMSDHDTGILLNYAIFEFIDINICNKLLKQKKIQLNNGTILELSNWNIRITN